VVSYFLAFLGFAALIILHEAGHFTAAKAVGMRVERFSLFFGKPLLAFRRGETEYGIGWIPAGGYVKITGMSPREELPPDIEPLAYYNQKVWKRIVVILAGPFVNLVIAFLILVVIFSTNPVVVQRHGQPVATGTIATGSLEQPASQYLKAGDKIVSVDGRRNLTVDQITAAISSHRCAGAPTAGCRGTTPVKLRVLRNGAPLTFSIYPRYDSSVKRMRVGFGFGELTHNLGAFDAAHESVDQMWTVTSDTVSRIAKLFEAKDRQQVHGIVGGFTVTQERFAFDSTEAFYTLALISLSLAVVNLFPFLPLDGGHVFWAVAEKIRGRRIPFDVMERAGVVGFVLIIMLFVVGLSNDISTLSGKGFNVR
jgi:regulator of sigma E protease